MTNFEKNINNTKTGTFKTTTKNQDLVTTSFNNLVNRYKMFYFLKNV